MEGELPGPGGPPQQYQQYIRVYRYGGRGIWVGAIREEPPVQGEPPRILPPIPGTPTRIAITAGASGPPCRGGLHFYPLCPSGSTDSGRERAGTNRSCGWAPVYKGGPPIGEYRYIQGTGRKARARVLCWHQSYTGVGGVGVPGVHVPAIPVPGEGMLYILCPPSVLVRTGCPYRGRG